MVATLSASFAAIVYGITSNNFVCFQEDSVWEASSMYLVFLLPNFYILAQVFLIQFQKSNLYLLL